MKRKDFWGINIVREEKSIKMSRQQLYDEIWEISVSGVAKKYNLNYGRLIETCRRENIPFPSSGYWTRRNMGKDVSGDLVLLPESETQEVDLLLNGVRIPKVSTQEEGQNVDTKPREPLHNIDDHFYNQLLLFLPIEERKKVIDKASSLQVNSDGKLHPVLVQYKQSIELYNKQLKEAQSREYYNPRVHNPKEKPKYISDVSNEGMKRVIAILDVLFKAIESLGGQINYDLSMKIKKDSVTVDFAESQDKVKHELTKQEARELVKYNDAIKYHHYASKPQIRQYDHVYNGKLRIVFGDHKYIRDKANEKLEDCLGDILIAIYEKAEEKRIAREQREEAQRKREEEWRRQEAIKQRKELEITKTKELVNIVQDYMLAYDIRAYIAAVENSNGEIDKDWIEWAKRKADWYDPIIALEDDFLGKREHGKSKEEKDFEKKTYNPYLGWSI